jgi:serine/threonine-protein kinase
MEEDSELYERSSARLGTTLRGKYRLDRVLGMGGMAVVYAATHRNLKRFALKMLHAELSIRDDIRTRFLREGYAANALDHPGAVAVLDDDVAEDGSAFLVMELLCGGGIDHLWEKSGRRMSPRVVMAIGYQLLDVLATAHAKGIVHRDIKPQNVFLTDEGALKVLDFGIARVRDVVASGMQTTGSGMVLGTPAFMAPEQAYGKSSEINGQSDVWAAGATLFTLLSGELVHEGENATQLLIQAATRPARSVMTVAPGAPPALAEIIDRALAFQKAARWQSAEAMRDAILGAYHALFGEPLSRMPLLDLFPASGSAISASPEIGPTQSLDAPRLVLAPELASPSSPRELPPSPRAVSAVGFSQSPMIGMGTSKAVSRDAADLPPSMPPRPRTSSMLTGAVVVGAIAVLFTAFEIGRSRGGAPALTPPESSSLPATGAPGAAVPPVLTIAATGATPSTNPVVPPPATLSHAAPPAVRTPVHRASPSEQSAQTSPSHLGPVPPWSAPAPPTSAAVPPKPAVAEMTLPARAQPEPPPAAPPPSYPLSPSVVGSPPPVGWTKCADENGTCILSGTNTVAYGANGRFVYRKVRNSIVCDKDTFQSFFSDIGKECFYR